jgi:hypothetical protein
MLRVTIDALDDASFNYDVAVYCADATDPTPTITGLSRKRSVQWRRLQSREFSRTGARVTPGTYTARIMTAGTCTRQFRC